MDNINLEKMRFGKALNKTNATFFIPDSSRLRMQLPENKIIVRDQFQTRRPCGELCRKKMMIFLAMIIFSIKWMAIMGFPTLRSKAVVTR